jgi:hypothetical protein
MRDAVSLLTADCILLTKQDFGQAELDRFDPNTIRTTKRRGSTFMLPQSWSRWSDSNRWPTVYCKQIDHKTGEIKKDMGAEYLDGDRLNLNVKNRSDRAGQLMQTIALFVPRAYPKAGLSSCAGAPIASGARPTHSARHSTKTITPNAMDAACSRRLSTVTNTQTAIGSG